MFPDVNTQVRTFVRILLLYYLRRLKLSSLLKLLISSIIFHILSQKQDSKTHPIFNFFYIQKENINSSEKFFSYVKTGKRKEQNHKPMTEQNQSPRPCKVDHTQFGGIVYPSDFNPNRRNQNGKNGSAIARRIACDLQFDRQCRKNTENRKIREEMKNDQRNDETEM